MVRRLSVFTLLPAVTLLALVACNGGTGGPGGPQAQITSHQDGVTVTGSRTLTVSGTLSGTGIASVDVELNGAPVAATFDPSSFSASLTLADNANVVEVTATNDAGQSGTARLTLDYPFLSLSDFQAASIVVGHPEFTGRDGGTDASSLRNPYGDALIHDGALYLPDPGNNRLLVFDEVPTTNGAAADRVLGQNDFTSAVEAVGADGAHSPQTVAVADGRLVVTDYGNSRVLIWNTLPTTNGAPADVVVGQEAFGTDAFACSRTSLNLPQSVRVAGDKLIVTDSGNHRVLVWNGVPTQSGAPADLVLGQQSFTSCAENDTNQDGVSEGVPNEWALAFPSDVWSDGERLIVADSNNYRVLIWNAFPTSNGAPADVVLGQPNFVTRGTGLTADTFQFPYYLDANGNQLFVADSDNNRVLIWNEIPTQNQVAADRVLGQADFTAKTPNDDDQDGATDATPTARTLSYPTGVRATGGKLLVTDNGNDRYLIFEPQ